jgi:hypothetical protein
LNNGKAVKSNSDPSINETNLTSRILIENSIDIPLLVLTEKDSLLDFRNLDSAKIFNNKKYLEQQIALFKSLNKPIVWKNPLDSTQINKVYYGKSALLKKYNTTQLFN